MVLLEAFITERGSVSCACAARHASNVKQPTIVDPSRCSRFLTAIMMNADCRISIESTDLSSQCSDMVLYFWMNGW